MLWILIFSPSFQIEFIDTRNIVDVKKKRRQICCLLPYRSVTFSIFDFLLEASLSSTIMLALPWHFDLSWKLHRNKFPIHETMWGLLWKRNFKDYLSELVAYHVIIRWNLSSCEWNLFPHKYFELTCSKSMIRKCLILRSRHCTWKCKLNYRLQYFLLNTKILSFDI